MRSLLSTRGLARTSASHPWRVVGAWVALLVLAIGIVAGFGMNLTTSAEFTNDPDSMKGANLLEDRLRGEDPVIETVVIRANAATIDDAAYQSIVQQTTADLRGLDGIVASADNYYETGNTALVSDDKRTTLIPVTLAGSFDDAEKHATEYIDAVNAERAEGFEVYTVGDVSIAEAFNTISEKDLQRAEGFGLPIALIILVIVFGALVAAGVPIQLR
jgi:RND superfamily putative drug exporter